MPGKTMEPQAVKKARYIMIGGFLGAGKTTAVGRLARHLVDRGLKVGLITNDQGRELVDTRMLRAQGFATEEIPGGCFCCRFNSLVEAADRLTADTQPDVFIAEPVGSCTDLVATVTYPLRRMYGDQFSIAPVSVLVDPIRAARVFGLEEGGTFSEKVLYIYKKQLEEADIIVINKADLIVAAQVETLRTTLQEKFPRARIVAVSSRLGTHLDEWFGKLESGEQTGAGAMEVDYDVYADGEALLGWFNGTVHLSASEEFEAHDVLAALALAIQMRLEAQHAEVAHLKMTYSPDEALAGEIAAVSLVRNDFVPELSLKLDEPSAGGQMIINLRAENAPDTLATIVREALAEIEIEFPTLKTRVDHIEHFRPGRPTPTHRDAAFVE
ncbi:MAG: GTP-binding protein [Verrucomicrobiales bacterium]